MENKLFEEAKEFIPGGVNSPARAYAAVDSDPVFIQKGTGSKIYDNDGNQYLDYVGSWGPMILGYNHPKVMETLKEQILKGTSFGAPTEVETKLAKLVVSAVSSVDKVRMVNSGTEATMSAIRLARGYTGRDKIVKMRGCYHGHGDSLLVEAGSGLATLGTPSSSGVPAKIAQETIVVPYNDLESLEHTFREYSSEIAGVILEPVPGNMGVIKPDEGYLQGVRELTKKEGAVLIFDEVMSGFRISYGGAQKSFGIEPDLTTFGKIIGGGLPVGAYGGKEEIMDQIAPQGSVYQAGTLSGNPLAMVAGIATLKQLKDSDAYQLLEDKGAYLEEGFKNNINELGIKASVSRVGSMISLFFTDEKVNDYKTAQSSNTDAFNLYFESMLAEGIYLPPSQFEANFISLAHSKSELKETIAANYKALREVKKEFY